MQLLNKFLHEHLYQGVLGVSEWYINLHYDPRWTWETGQSGIQKLQKAQLYANLSKCNFHKTSLDYLGIESQRRRGDGHRKSENNIRVEALSNHETVSFLGFANFYHQFIPFGQVALKNYQLAENRKGGTKPPSLWIGPWSFYNLSNLTIILVKECPRSFFCCIRQQDGWQSYCRCCHAGKENTYLQKQKCSWNLKCKMYEYTIGPINIAER